MKKISAIVLVLILINISIKSQQNNFFSNLTEKKIATFNDGITLIRLLFKESDFEATYIENIIWSIEKKLFRVTLPITNDKFNPLLTRGMFSLWVCKIYNNPKGLTNNKNIMLLSAFKTCVKLGLIKEGKGAFDSMTGAELLDTFAYIDYYVRANKIMTNPDILKKESDEYDRLPEWRERLYREIEEQRKAEKEAFDKVKKEKREKKIKVKQQEKKSEIKIEE